MKTSLNEHVALEYIQNIVHIERVLYIRRTRLFMHTAVTHEPLGDGAHSLNTEQMHSQIRNSPSCHSRPDFRSSVEDKQRDSEESVGSI